jgi:hypothetical protein
MKFIKLGGFAAYTEHMKAMRPITKAKKNKVKRRMYYEKNVSNNNANGILSICYTSFFNHLKYH